MKKLIVLLLILLVLWVIIDQHRYFIYNKDGKECITIWKRFGFSTCYVIPGKYRSPFKPTSNYIKTTNAENYFGIVWNTEDEYNCKLSIYNRYQTVELDNKVKVYDNNDVLLLEYKILDSFTGAHYYYNKKKDELREKYDYRYIKLNGLSPIKVFYKQ